MPDQRALSILQITDLHILPKAGQTMLGIDTEHYYHRVVELAFKTQHTFDLILITGDLTQEPSPASYQRIADYLIAYGIPVVCLPGNHDDYDLMQSVFNTDLINCQKHRLLSSQWQLICLNSQLFGTQDGNLAQQELEFLDHYLFSHPDHYTLIAVHHHCLDSGSAWLDTMKIKNSDDFFNIIDRYPNVRAICHGHIHQAQDTLLDSTRIVATPSTCFQFKPNNQNFGVETTPPGYRHITLFADGSIKTDVTRLPGSLLELDASNRGY